MLHLLLKRLKRMKVINIIYMILGSQLVIFIIWMLFFRRNEFIKDEYEPGKSLLSRYEEELWPHNRPQSGPPMGWNSWNKFHCDGLNEKLAYGVIDSLIKTGLAKAGYVYVNLDDCWQFDRNGTGHLVPDLKRFPKGMKHLADYVHKHNMMFGLYTDQGTLTCERRPGVYNHEEQDALTYAEWGVDFMKNDDCYIHPSSDIYENYKKFWDGIQKSGRKMIHSVKSSVTIERAAEISSMRRVGEDIQDEFEVMLALVDRVIKEKLWEYSKPGFWNDLDMLEIGNGGMTEDEYIAHMALWCVLKAPLLLGNDLENMDDFTLKLLKHPGFLAINQDPLQESAQLIHSEYAAGGTAQQRVVIQRCESLDRRQHWIFYPEDKVIKSVKTGQCLSLEADNVVMVVDCEKTRKNQQWSLDSPSGQLFSLSEPSSCITARWSIGADAKLKKCEDRSKTKNKDDTVYWWNLFSDHFEYHKVPGSAPRMAITFFHKAYCLSVGAPEDIMIFGGRLSNNRHVALLLNRDVIPHDVSLDFTILPHIENEGQGTYTLTDVWQMTELGEYTHSYKATLAKHSSKTIIFNKV